MPMKRPGGAVPSRYHQAIADGQGISNFGDGNYCPTPDSDSSTPWDYSDDDHQHLITSSDVRQANGSAKPYTRTQLSTSNFNDAYVPSWFSEPFNNAMLATDVSLLAPVMLAGSGVEASPTFMQAAINAAGARLGGDATTVGHDISTWSQHPLTNTLNSIRSLAQSMGQALKAMTSGSLLPNKPSWSTSLSDFDSAGDMLADGNQIVDKVGSTYRFFANPSISASDKGAVFGNALADVLEIGAGLVAGVVTDGVGVGVQRGVRLFQDSVGTSRKVLDPFSIRFSQETISYMKLRPNGLSYTFDDIVSSMKAEGWLESAGPIDVVKMPEGGFSSLDNTRIFAAREAGINVIAEVHNYNEKLPESMAQRFEHPTVPGVYAETWGEALEYRIFRQSFNFQEQYASLGSYDEPIINYPKN